MYSIQFGSRDLCIVCPNYKIWVKKIAQDSDPEQYKTFDLMASVGHPDGNFYQAIH